jgi:hypothetical protein
MHEKEERPTLDPKGKIGFTSDTLPRFFPVNRTMIGVWTCEGTQKFLYVRDKSFVLVVVYL